jgi:aminopeptidase N
MRNSESQPVLREQYRSPAYLLERIELEFDLDLDVAEVASLLHLRRNPGLAGEQGAERELALDGEQLDLLSIELDGQPVEAARFRVDERQLVLAGPLPERFTLRVRNRVRPRANSTLMGLYASNGSLFTQCEAEGMRRITWMLDRPDVLARYSVLLKADRSLFPVLLSNGNLVEHGELPHGRHFARWEDPHPKPCYLFALVAGALSCLEEHTRTRGGRDALLQIWAAPPDLARLGHAAACLRRAIAWDEVRFGRELDLDRYMIVATADFNMGAMENKGLNIFNAKYVLADASIATDADFATIESIIGHEYFHNWSGNRVTCRDWFQLSLKEGLTVFRDQEFTRDLLAREALALGTDPASARAIARIDDVRALRSAQFPEDAGPMAHAIRPDSYLEISNFYTATVYEKGAEVVRMLQTLLGIEGFRRGLDLYFTRHDGQAATCEDLVAAMADSSGRDLTQFLRWYAQAGTPRVTVRAEHDEGRSTLTLHLAQSCPPTPGQATKEPLHIPFAVGLVGPGGEGIAVRIVDEATGASGPGAETQVVELTEAEHTVRLAGVPAGAVPSLLRDFSAPVIVEYEHEDRALALLAAHDRDGFNRWEAGQKLAMSRLVRAVDAVEAGRPPVFDTEFLAVARRTLADESTSHALRERALLLPGEVVIAERREVVDPVAVRAARNAMRRWLGGELRGEWLATHARLAPEGAYSPDSAHAGRRALRNLALAQLTLAGDPDMLALARAQLAQADNLTDRLAALSCIVHSPAPDKAEVLLQVARDWQHEPLLMNKWFSLQAQAPSFEGEPPVIERVRALLRHPAYAESNPNSVYALVLGFCNGNPAEFHREDGSGYEFWAGQVLRLDPANPIVAARVARTMERWRRFGAVRQARMQEALREVVASPSLSRDVREVVERSLAG